ncbi:hypothetical protein ANO11243_091730 [Dothideomycetidae sp. 11243]|nr:hypothetical protein ANO11243_091730 [fungal sp. No.11243]
MVKIESVLLGYGSGALLTPLIVIIVTFIAAATFLWNALLRQSTHYKHLPKSVQGWPVIGCWQFWSRRADFHLENSSQSPSGNFHYRVGPYSVVAVSGKDSRKVFFEHSSLDLNGGYDVLFAGAPPGPATGTKQAIPEDNFAQVLGKRLKALITTPRLQRSMFDPCLNID